MKKFGLSTVALLLIMVAFLSACSSNGGARSTSESGSNSQANNTSGGPAEEETVIQIWGGGVFLQEGEAGHAVAQQINEKYKGKIRVETRYMPWDEFNTALQAAFSSGDVPDIFQLPSGVTHAQYASRGFIRPIDDIVSDEWKASFSEGSFVEGKNVIDGETYSWPIQGPSLNMILFYNKDVMENAGLDPNQPPTSWDELYSMSKKVQESNSEAYGLIYSGTGYTSGLLTVMGLAAGAKPEAFGNNDMFGFNFKTGQYEFSSPEFSDAVKFFKKMDDEGLIFPGSLLLTHPEARVLFAHNQAAFHIAGYYNLGWIKEEGANFGVAPPPSQNGNKPYINYDVAFPDTSFVVSATTKNPEAVGIVIEEGIASHDYFIKLMEPGRALAPMPELIENKDYHPYPEFTEFAELSEDIMRAMPDPTSRSPEGVPAVFKELGGNLIQPHMNPQIGDIIEMYMLGEIDDIDEALREYDERLNKNLKDAIDKVNAQGIDISIDAFIFPDWDPTKDYIN